jgi:hypothetical protein
MNHLALFSSRIKKILVVYLSVHGRKKQFFLQLRMKSGIILGEYLSSRNGCLVIFYLLRSCSFGLAFSFRFSPGSTG